MNHAIEIVRSSTDELHRALETTSLSRKLMSADVNEMVVVEFLQANLDCLRVLEPIIFAEWPREQLYQNFGFQSEIETLERDLARFANSSRPHRIVYDNAPCSRECACGGLYVLLGSKFGRQQIKKHLETQKIPSIGQLAYFAAPALNAAQWRQFLAMLNLLGQDSSSLEEIVRGAKDFFKVYHKRWLVFNQ